MELHLGGLRLVPGLEGAGQGWACLRDTGWGGELFERDRERQRVGGERSIG